MVLGGGGGVLMYMILSTKLRFNQIPSEVGPSQRSKVSRAACRGSSSSCPFIISVCFTCSGGTVPTLNNNKHIFITSGPFCPACLPDCSQLFLLTPASLLCPLHLYLNPPRPLQIGAYRMLCSDLAPSNVKRLCLKSIRSLFPFN